MRALPSCTASSLALIAALATGCVTDRGGPGATAGPAPHGERSRAGERVQAPVLTAGQVLGAFAAASAGQLQAAELAMRSARREDVRDVAREVVRDHGKILTDIVELSRALRVGLEDSAVGAAVRDRSARRATLLGKAIKAPDFDDAYARSQVDASEAALRLVDDALLPAADVAIVEQFLMSARPALRKHVEHAQGLAARVQLSAQRSTNSATALQ